MKKIHKKNLFRSTSASTQTGVALITVLMVFAIASVIAAKIIVTKVLDTQRTTGLINRTQAYYYALATEELAILALQEDIKNDRDCNAEKEFCVDHLLEESWATGPYQYEIDSIGLSTVKIIDLDRYYNLNNILTDGSEINLDELERFRGLLRGLELDERLADNLRDWLDRDDQVHGNQSDGNAYEQLQPGYRVANRSLIDLSELRLVQGFTSEVMNLLIPHVVVLPSQAFMVMPININTASSATLMTLTKSRTGANSAEEEGISATEADDIVSARVPYRSVQELIDLQLIKELNSSTLLSNGVLMPRMSVQSTTYQINIITDYAGSRAYLSTVVQFLNEGSELNFTVLSRNEANNAARFL
tara:strand:+ start:384 stop:1466 length:1083 start_codon:yes stop_codon:yes gene_type:complete